MKWMRNTVLLLTALLALGGCGSNPSRVESMQPGASADEVTRQAGKPAGTWREGGVEIWEYPTGPIGTETYLARFDASGRLAEVRQVLTYDNFDRVSPGASPESVQHLLGRPGSALQYPRLNEEVWTWRFLEGSTPRRFNVHFDDKSKRVTRTSYTDEHRP